MIKYCVSTSSLLIIQCEDAFPKPFLSFMIIKKGWVVWKYEVFSAIYFLSLSLLQSKLNISYFELDFDYFP